MSIIKTPNNKTSTNTKRLILQNVDYDQTLNTTKRLILQHVDYYKTLNTTNVQYYRMLHCVGLGRVKKLFGPSAATFCIIDFVIPSFNNRYFVSLCSEKSIRKKKELSLSPISLTSDILNHEFY